MQRRVAAGWAPSALRFLLTLIVPASTPESPTDRPAWLGVARFGLAWPGLAWPGLALAWRTLNACKQRVLVLGAERHGIGLRQRV